MDDLGYAAVLVLTAVGAFCSGMLWDSRRVLYWKIKWIKVEHELARLQKREPRDAGEE